VGTLHLVAIGAPPRDMLPHLATFLETRLGRPCRTSERVIEPDPAWDRQRGQVDCRRLFPLLDTCARELGGSVLGVADVDLFSAVFTFVFGESRLGGEVAMMSLHRLRPESYGLSRDAALLAARAEREALHEVGHLLGLVHCKHPECVMRFSGSVEEVDLKPAAFCPRCAAQIESAHPALRREG